MKICPNCKKENNDNVNFCNACGTALPSNSVAAVQPQAPVPKKSKGMIIVIVALIAVVAILATVVALLASKLNSKPEGDSTIPSKAEITELVTDEKDSAEDGEQTAASPEEGTYYINNDSTSLSKIELKDGEAYLTFNLLEGICVGKAKYKVTGNTIALDYVTAYSFMFDGETTYVDESPDAAMVINPGATLTINNNVISPQNFEQYWIFEGWGLPMDYYSGSQFYKAQ